MAWSGEWIHQETNRQRLSPAEFKSSSVEQLAGLWAACSSLSNHLCSSGLAAVLIYGGNAGVLSPTTDVRLTLSLYDSPHDRGQNVGGSGEMFTSHRSNCFFRTVSRWKMCDSNLAFLKRSLSNSGFINEQMAVKLLLNCYTMSQHHEAARWTNPSWFKHTPVCCVEAISPAGEWTGSVPPSCDLLRSQYSVESCAKSKEVDKRRSLMSPVTISLRLEQGFDFRNGNQKAVRCPNKKGQKRGMVALNGLLYIIKRAARAVNESLKRGPVVFCKHPWYFDQSMRQTFHLDHKNVPSMYH